MAEYDLISKTALLEHLDMAMECENCPRNANKELYKCVHNLTPERCTCSDIAQICIRITEFATFADVQPVNQWISVKDRLPDKFDYVLCYCKTTTGEGNVFMYGAYHKDTWWLKTCRTYATLEQPQMRVMYWMPLPEPPQD